MTDKISLDYIGPDTGIALLIAKLEEAGDGTTTVTAEPEPVDNVDDSARTYHGEISGLAPDKALAAVQAFLAVTAGHTVTLGGIQVPPLL